MAKKKQINVDRLIFFQHECETAENEYAKNPLDADNLTKWGAALLEMSSLQGSPDSKNMTQDAISKLDEALSLNPENHYALWLLGNAYASHACLIKGEANVSFEKATEYYQRAVREAPDNHRYKRTLNAVAVDYAPHFQAWKPGFFLQQQPAAMAGHSTSTPSKPGFGRQQQQQQPAATVGHSTSTPSMPGFGRQQQQQQQQPAAMVGHSTSTPSKTVAGLASQTDEGPKKTYASVLMKKDGAPSSTVTSASVKSASKSQEHQSTAAPPPSSMLETNGSGVNTNESGNNQENEAEDYSVYLKWLSPNTTPALLENEFKKFGPIKSGGIQVRTQKGFNFTFVEFEVASAVQKALEASPILVNGRNVVVEEKRSTNRGNSRGRFSSGRAPGYSGEGVRGRGNYRSGRSFGRRDFNGRGGDGRGDFSGRGEYGYRNGNRGGFSNRGGDGYQRSDHMGNNGGHQRDHMGYIGAA